MYTYLKLVEIAIHFKLVLLSVAKLMRYNITQFMKYTANARLANQAVLQEKISVV